MRNLVCGTCGISQGPTAMFLSQGKAYWSAPPEDAARYETRCQDQDRALGPGILGCRFMRQTLDPWFLPEHPHRWPASEPVTVQPVADLIAASPDAAERHGISALRTIAGPGEYTRRPPDLFDWINTASHEPVDITTLVTLTQRYAPLRLLTLRHAIVADQGAVITSGGALLHDSFAELLAQGHTPTGLTRTPDGQYQRTGPVNRRIDTPTLLLKRPWWCNYGHFLLDAAALLALLCERGIGGFAQVAVGACPDAKLRDIICETLAIIAPGLKVIEHPDDDVWQFSTLHYCQPVQIPDLFKLPDALAALRHAVLGGARRLPGDRRLFISRRQYRTRRLENEADIVQVCARHGFEVICPETLTLREQAHLFAAASHVIGVKGSALANLLFSPAATTVILLSPADWADFFFWDLAGQRGFPYYELTGPLTRSDSDHGQNPFVIDPRRLDAVLGSVLTGAGHAAGPGL